MTLNEIITKLETRLHYADCNEEVMLSILRDVEADIAHLLDGLKGLTQNRLMSKGLIWR